MSSNETLSVSRAALCTHAFSLRGKSISLCSALVLSLSLAVGSAHAQDNPTDKKTADEPVVLEEVVVKGVRASLITAQEIKQQSPTFVDSIVAQDIGKLPDNTVADALQHVPGIQVARAEGEIGGPNSVVIRGLPNIETTINGYEVFTGTSRGVALQDIPAEMIFSVDAYKTVGPDQLEGGTSGSIDIRLRRPFNFKSGLSVNANARGMRGDQSKKNSFFLSGLVNNRWKTSLGEFGALFDFSYAKRRYEDQVFDNWVHYPEFFDIAYDGSGQPGYFADNFGFQIRRGDRTRPAAQLALQWKTNTDIELYTEGTYTGYKNRHDVDFFIGIPSWGGSRSNVVLYPAGYMGVNIPVRALNPDGSPSGLPQAGQPARWVKSFTAQGTNTIISKQAFDDYTNTFQGATGIKWGKDALKLYGEVSYNISMVKTRGAILDTIAQNNNQVWNITYNDGSNPSVQSTGLDFTNPANFVATNLFDQWSKAYSAQYAGKVDALLTLQNEFIKSLKFGTRYGSRTVHFHQANPAANWRSGWIPVNSVSPNLGVVTSNNLFVSTGDMNVRTWWSPSTDFLLDNTDAVRVAGGLSRGSPPADPASTFNDDEKTLAFYGLANYKFDIGSLPVDGVVGARAVQTKQTLGAYQNPVDANGSSIPDQFRPVSISNSYWDTIPTVTARLHFTEKLLSRFSFTKTQTRPNFGDLNPALALFHSGPTSQVGTGTGGNPKLDPIKSTNYDLSLEYYFTKTSQASVTLFDHKLTGYVQSFAKLENVGGTNYLITRPQNTGKGKLRGYELSYQQFFDFLSVDALKGLGFQINYTGITGTTESPTTKQQQDITQVAKKNYNAILIYEIGAFSSRFAYTYRGTYIDSYNQPGFQPSTVYVEPTKTLDFSASYAITKQLTLTVDATNILKDKYKDHFGPTQMFGRDVRNYDQTIALGMRYSY
ncbi:MAG: TonB-dependent receptor [Nibricoccus sp.]